MEGKGAGGTEAAEGSTVGAGGGTCGCVEDGRREEVEVEGCCNSVEGCGSSDVANDNRAEVALAMEEAKGTEAVGSGRGRGGVATELENVAGETRGGDFTPSLLPTEAISWPGSGSQRNSDLQMISGVRLLSAPPSIMGIETDKLETAGAGLSKALPARHVAMSSQSLEKAS